MPENEISGPEQADRSIVDKLWSKRAELLWGLVVVIMLLTFVDPVVLIGPALVLATIVAAWAGFHELLDRAKQDDAKSPAAPLRAAPASQTRSTRQDRSRTHAVARRHPPRRLDSGGRVNCAVPPVSPYRRNRAESLWDQRPVRAHTPAARRSAAATSSAPSRTAFPRSTKISLSAVAA